jgi:hypothetical protein
MWLTLSNIAAICAMLWVLTAAQDPNAGSPDPFRPGKKYWIDKESCGTRPEVSGELPGVGRGRTCPDIPKLVLTTWMISVQSLVR